MITSRTIALGIVKAVGILLAFSLLLLFIYKTQTVILYLVVSLIFALIANPIVEFLQRRLKFKPILAILTTIALVLISIFLFFLQFLPLISSQTESLALLNIEDIENNIDLIYIQFESYLATHNVKLDKTLKNFDH